MTEQAFPTLNGEAQSWANCSATIQLYDGASIDMSGMTAVKWGVEVERGLQRSTNGKIVKTTRGQATPSASIELYADQEQALIEALIDAAIAKGYVENGIAKYGMVAFDLVVQHTPLGGLGVQKTEVLGCKLSGNKGEFAEGTDPDKSEVGLSILDVVRTINGKKGSIL